MNIKLKLTFIFYFITLSLFAQRFQYGAKLGAGTSNTTNLNGISKPRIGLLGGAIVKYQLSDRTEEHYIQTELIYSNQGEFSKDKQGNKYKNFVDYIHIPILYKYYFDDQGSDFFLEGGPQIGFVVSDKIDTNAPEFDNNILKNLDLGINLGVGYSYNRKAEINLRYSYGLIDTYDYKRWNNGQNKTTFLTLAFTYFFNI